MRLSALLEGFGPPSAAGPHDVDVSGVAVDSRAVRPGDLFVALAGRHTDGARHVADAVARGARAVVGEHAVPDASVPVVVTANARAVVGVTGTNGKTTTTYLLDGIFRAAGRRTGVIGTIAYRVGDAIRPAPFTTPEAPALQGLLADMRAAGVTHVAMEVSSHALAQHRADGIRFDAAAFTNLTRDHLDFHGTMEAYFAAKARLFDELLPGSGKPDPVAVVHVPDAWGAALAARCRTRCVTVGRDAGATVRLRALDASVAGNRVTLDVAGRTLVLESALVGAPHAENVAVAAAAAWALGIGDDAIVAGIARAEPPAGRVERIAGPGFTVVVDYAHTPDALERLLAALRPLTRGALVTVFGCGGDRDPGKRPIMGEAAARASDLVVVTSDNPRTEDPAAIIAAIEPGVRAGGLAPLARATAGVRGYVVEPDRPAAIALAVRLAQPGDVVVVAGKGHEDYQIVGTEKHHLDDREEVRRALEQRA